tara:strand:- start:1919 stop:2899 length:981 start_codon:yes stop_codon:yes gene_type:complete
MKDVYSIFNIEGYGHGLTECKIPSALEEVLRNDIDVEKLKLSLAKHKKNNLKFYDDIIISSDSIDNFNKTVNNISKRSKTLRTSNKSLVRVLKYGQGKIANIIPDRLMPSELRGVSTQDLVEIYSGYFNDQAADFGELFYQVVQREDSLTDYNKSLVSKNQLYNNKSEDLERLLVDGGEKREDIAEKILDSEGFSDITKNSLIKRVDRKYAEIESCKDSVEMLVCDNENATTEVDGLLDWCSGMKNILASGKERMDNHAVHLREAMTTYLQAISLNRAFRETNSAVKGLVEVMKSAQMSADKGFEDVSEFVKNRGIFGREKYRRRY